MGPEERALLKELGDLYHPDDGDPMETALAASDRFASSMSRSIAAHLTPAIIGISAIRGMAIDDTIVCPIPSSDGVFVLHVGRADRLSGRQAISCWYAPNGEDDKPRQVASVLAVSDGNRVRTEAWEPIEDWPSILELSRLLAPYSVNSLSNGRTGTVCDRVVEADGGLPGNLTLEALKIVQGHLVRAATEGAEDLLEDTTPLDAIDLGDGWMASRRDNMPEATHFTRKNGSTFTISRQTGGLMIQAIDQKIVVEQSGRVDFDIPPTNDLLFAVASAIGRASSHLKDTSWTPPGLPRT